MKIKDGFLVREVAGTHVVVAVGARMKEFNGIIKLNQTGVFLWENMKQDTDIQKLTEALTAEYDVSAEQAERDVENFVNTLKEVGIIQA